MAKIVLVTENTPDPPAPGGVALYFDPSDKLLRSEDQDGNVTAYGGSQPGVAIVRKFPFTFATAGLLTGATVYTPTIGDILLNAWLEVDTAWDGTTPFGDFGGFQANFGWLGNEKGPKDMTIADTHEQWGDELLTEDNGAGNAPGDMLMGWLDSLTSQAWFRGVPAKFRTATPVKVCVSQNGQSTGADPGAMQGAAILYLVTATPA